MSDAEDLIARLAGGLAPADREAFRQAAEAALASSTQRWGAGSKPWCRCGVGTFTRRQSRPRLGRAAAVQRSKPNGLLGRNAAAAAARARIAGIRSAIGGRIEVLRPLFPGYCFTSGSSCNGIACASLQV